MGIRSLAEAIILQSMEDLYSKRNKEDCKTFFNGGGFSICANIAGIKLFDQLKLLNMINDSIKRKRKLTNRPRRRNYIEYSVGRGR